MQRRHLPKSQAYSCCPGFCLKTEQGEHSTSHRTAVGEPKHLVTGYRAPELSQGDVLNHMAGTPWQGTCCIPGTSWSMGRIFTHMTLGFMSTLVHTQHSQHCMACDFVRTCSFQTQAHCKLHATLSQKGCLIHKHAFYSFTILRRPSMPQN